MEDTIFLKKHERKRLPSNDQCPPKVRRLAWATILLQLSLPIMTAFTPTVTASTSSTRSYTAQNRGAVTETEQKLASSLMATGTALSQDNSGEALANTARSMATQEVNQSVQQWLNQFGTARIQLQTDKNFQLDNSEMDFLFPLYDRRSSMFFTQLGMRYHDSRTTLNVGVGGRYYTDSWMYGLNTFFDNDLTGNNKRIGLGAEAWTNYLKFSTNGYFALTDWHQSRDFIAYDERPANGYDLRAEGYLPIYPQVGGKLMYEKYYGDNVTLFGQNHMQKDPYAFTIGTDYTPIPLLTLGIEHRQGREGKNDTLANLQLTYRFGESWQSQIDPSLVSSSRSLLGSRYDLVERNNNIVLDHQKRSLIRLMLPTQLTGMANTKEVLTAQITTKHDLDRIDWDASELIAAGGSMNVLSPQQIEITYPDYQLTRNTANTYRVHGVAQDIQGNRSERVSTTIRVEENTAINLHMQVTKNNAKADDVDLNEVSVTVTGGDGRAIPNQRVVFQSSSATLVENEGVTNDQGIAVAQLTSRTSGRDTLTATVDQQIKSIETHFIASTDTAKLIDLLIITNEQVTGTEPNKIEVLVKDKFNNPLIDFPVNFTADKPNDVNIIATKTDKDGFATAMIHATKAGNYEITAKITGLPGYTEKKGTVTFKADTESPQLTELIMIKEATVSSSGIDVKAVVKDPNGDAIKGVKVNFKADLGQIASEVTTNDKGEAIAKLTSTKAGESAVTATIQSVAEQTKTGKIKFKADANKAQLSDLGVNKDVVIANGSDHINVTATILDSYSNPIEGVKVSFTTTNQATIPGTGYTDVQGKAKVSLMSTKAGDHKVTAKIDVGNQSKEKNVRSKGDPATAVLKDLIALPKASGVVGRDVITIIAEVKDKYDNPVEDHPLRLIKGNIALSLEDQSPFSGRTDRDGKVKYGVTGLVVGDYEPSVKMDPGNQEKRIKLKFSLR